jgi:protein-tyrosine phosphatase
MDYIIGTFYILKNKLCFFNIFENIQIPRIKSILPWYVQYMYFYSAPTEIINNLYLGSSFNAYAIQNLKNKNVNVIINITEEIDNFHQNDSTITYYKFPIRDNNIDDITDILEQTYHIIDEHLNNENGILVHCYMGASRSASIIIYYLMKKYNMTFEEANNYVYNKRKLVNLSQKFDTTLKLKNENR